MFVVGTAGTSAPVGLGPAGGVRSGLGLLWAADSSGIYYQHGSTNATRVLKFGRTNGSVQVAVDAYPGAGLRVLAAE
ncbi:MAG: hypothetical protein KC503_25585 [Myxococcales bacterium]|nr:hypothetical protein [Myxococcales bacterium]